ncbi:hypothetical protein BDF22DRAFT_682698 [Syncephalis plumigaleata]|nr:hypothetical protein BDF22DRAFT_682698 [Syncephalis plumigaleata]
MHTTQHWIVVLAILVHVAHAEIITDRRDDKWENHERSAKPSPNTPRFSVKAPVGKADALGEPGLIIKAWFPDTPTTSSAAVIWNQRDGYLKCNKQRDRHKYEIKVYTTLYQGKYKKPQTLLGPPHPIKAKSFSCFILPLDYSPVPLMEFTNTLREQGRIDDLVRLAALLLAAGAQVHRNELTHGDINPDSVIVGKSKTNNRLSLHLINYKPLPISSSSASASIQPHRLMPGYEPPEFLSMESHPNWNKVDDWSSAATAFTTVIGRPLSGPYYHKKDKIESWSADSLDKSMAEINVVSQKKRLSYDELTKKQQEHLHELSEVLNQLLEPKPEKRKSLEEMVKPTDSLFKPFQL